MREELASSVTDISSILLLAQILFPKLHYTQIYDPKLTSRMDVPFSADDDLGLDTSDEEEDDSENGDDDGADIETGTGSKNAGQQLQAVADKLTAVVGLSTSADLHIKLQREGEE